MNRFFNALRLKKLTISLITIFSFSNINGLKAEEILNIGAIPDQNPERINRLYNILSNELSEQLNIKVRYVPVINYSAAVTAFRTGHLDLVWFGGLTGVQARHQTKGAKVIAQRDIDEKFHSVFIANKKSSLKKINNINELKYLKDKRFTFGSESSTSGRLMPQYFLNKAGVQLKDFKGSRPGFSGSHDATLMLVQSGSYEAGALNEQVWESNLKSGRIDPSKVFVIWKTPSYYDYHWLAQGNLDKKFRKGFTEELTNFFLNLNEKSINQKKILELFGAKKFIPSKNENYNKIEKIGREIGKIH
tara:strand:- start:3556 stop:4467 length:912 start_codon:yes stop_codon:yes gene_type:complete